MKNSRNQLNKVFKKDNQRIFLFKIPIQLKNTSYNQNVHQFKCKAKKNGL